MGKRTERALRSKFERKVAETKFEKTKRRTGSSMVVRDVTEAHATISRELLRRLMDEDDIRSLFDSIYGDRMVRVIEPQYVELMKEDLYGDDGMLESLFERELQFLGLLRGLVGQYGLTIRTSKQIGHRVFKALTDIDHRDGVPVYLWAVQDGTQDKDGLPLQIPLAGRKYRLNQLYATQHGIHATLLDEHGKEMDNKPHMGYRIFSWMPDDELGCPWFFSTKEVVPNMPFSFPHLSFEEWDAIKQNLIRYMEIEHAKRKAELDRSYYYGHPDDGRF